MRKWDVGRSEEWVVAAVREGDRRKMSVENGDGVIRDGGVCRTMKRDA